MKRLLLIFGTIGVGMFIAWTFLLIRPALNEENRLSQELSAVERSARQLEHDVAELPGMLKTQAGLSEQERQQALNLFTSQEILSLLDKIGHQCNNYALRINEIRPPVEELIELQKTRLKIGEPQFLNITLVLEGSYSNFGRFVTQIERAPYFRGVNYSRLQSAAVPSGPSQFLLEFRVLLGRIAEARG